MFSCLSFLNRTTNCKLKITEFKLPEQFSDINYLLVTVHEDNFEEFKKLLCDVEALEYYIKKQKEFRNRCYQHLEDDLFIYYDKYGARSAFFDTLGSKKFLSYLCDLYKKANKLDDKLIEKMFHLVGRDGTPETIDYLLSLGAKIDCLSGIHDHSALTLAFNWNRKENVKHLLKRGANINILMRHNTETIFKYNMYSKTADDIKYVLQYCSVDTIYKALGELNAGMRRIQHYDEIKTLFKKYLERATVFQKKDNVLDTIKNHDILVPIIKEKHIVANILKMKYEMEFIEYVSNY